MSKRLIGFLLAAALLSGAIVANAATGKSLARTDHQAARYLEAGLKSWAHVDLRKARSKAAFCVSAAEQSGYATNKQRFRTFSCVFDVTSRSGKQYVFGLDLRTTRNGWRATADP